MNRNKASFIPYFLSFKMDKKGNISIDPCEVHDDPEFQELLRKAREHVYGKPTESQKKI